VRLKNLLLFVCFFISIASFSQSADSVDQSDATSIQKDYEEKDSHAFPDTSAITPRTADAETLQKLKSDPDMQYKEPPTIAESLWERLMLLIQQFIASIFESAIATNWGRVLTYVIGIVLMVVLIMMLLRVNAFKVFYSGEGSGTFRHNVLDENIHEMNFEKLIDEAAAKKDYRGGVRLLFLYALKMLSDQNHIHWDQGKTNHDYIDELKLAELKPGFSDLNYYFEYAWYGNFNVNAETFDHVRDIFKTWKTNLK